MLQWFYKIHLISITFRENSNGMSNYTISFSDVDTFFINPFCDPLLDILSPTYIILQYTRPRNTQEYFQYLFMKGLFPEISCISFPALIPLFGIMRWHHGIEFLHPQFE